MAKRTRRKPPKTAQERRKALLSAIGLWKDRTDLPDSEAYVRCLRTDRRSMRIPKDSERKTPTAP